MKSFSDLGLRDELLQALNAVGYTAPTDIQASAIPEMLAGRDVIAQAHTGTGKTAAFALPMLSRLDLEVKRVQGLVVVPTRELATQVTRAFNRYGKQLGVHALAVYGGQSYAWQGKKLAEGVQVVVCTPGRALDLIEKGTLKLDGVTCVALDEADEMLRMGFIDDVDKLLGATPETRQTALFSATIPPPVRALSEKYMREPVSIGHDKAEMTVAKVTQRFCLISESSKLATITRLLETEPVERALVFARTRLGCAQLADALIARGFTAEALHGDLPQEARESVLARFRAGRIALLVATDVAARGLDIPSVSHVFNYDFPDQPADYVHRIGRTARAGTEGTAISLVTPREQGRLAMVGHYTKSPAKRMVVPTVGEVHARRDHRFAERVDQVAVEDNLDPSLRWVDEQVASGKDLRTLTAALVQLVRGTETTRPDEYVEEIFPKSKPPGARMGAPRRGGGGGYPSAGDMGDDRGPRGRGERFSARPSPSKGPKTFAHESGKKGAKTFAHEGGKKGPKTFEHEGGKKGPKTFEHEGGKKGP
ncbi:MAG: DEAD/DEAH box helicase, partial [Proteobacteria bacterium]|nr:DEAD/DEAH box helicase [Pseudomonadota bacterium]